MGLNGVLHFAHCIGAEKGFPLNLWCVAALRIFMVCDRKSILCFTMKFAGFDKAFHENFTPIERHSSFRTLC